ncbi:MAG: ATP-binding protein [Methanomassiliicoccales archaeon]|nr:MAG: ATP-binding protein [Methanomassiliicoccales archaeon]
MTTLKELRELANSGERMTVEFKETLSEAVIRGLSTDFASFANTSGGIIVIGIDDSHNLVGYRPEKSERNRISQEAGNCRPPVLIDFQKLTFQKKHFLVVNVPVSSSFHCDKRFRYPVRVGNTTQFLDPAGIITLVRNRLFD